ncbi:histidine kinase [Polymorphospora sp. NPDC050346]|uniref:sensor histidine kinase n=1 Tax=Polymorphospora sp. NPDC050346 TaxID=3155780 RepID=UPI003405510A
MTIFGWIREQARRRPLPTDVLFALTVLAVTLPLLGEPGGGTGRDAVRLGCLLVAGAAVAVRRRWPLPALAAASLAAAVGGGEGPMIAVLVTVYTVSVRTDRRTAWLGGTAATVLTAIGALVDAGGAVPPVDLFGLLIWTALGTSVGDAVRNRRAYVDAMRDRAERAERTREEEAQRRVVAERIRIARELHDVVAHHIALVNAQAGVAVHLMDRHPALAREALGHIRDTSGVALDELRATVGLLRQSGDPAAPREPVPGLAGLDDLVASFARAGLTVDVRRSGQVVPLPPLVELSAYRITQEALTNVHKHARTGRAEVDLRYEPDRVRITIRDDGPARSRPDGSARAGHGLIGMRERVDAVGGTFRAGPRPAGGFEVAVELVLRGAAVAAPAGPAVAR